MKLKTESELSLMDMNENIYSHETTSVKNNQFSNFLLKSFQELYNTVNHVFRTVKNESRTVYWIVTVTFALGFLSLIGLAIDDRTLMGVNVWVKPVKFTVSTAIYILTIGFLLTLFPYSITKKRVINGIVTWTLFIEVAIIICQASRGVQSHYNTSGLFNAVLYLGMGFLIMINVLILIMLVIDTIRLKLNTKKSIQWAILIGLLIVLFSSWIGGQMISQLSHNVGVADGGSGLPLVNWSTVGGDLRIAHFFGLHGIQIIPFFAFWVLKKWQLPFRNQIILVTIFGLLYAAWIGFVFYQAKQGIPLIQM